MKNPTHDFLIDAQTHLDKINDSRQLKPGELLATVQEYIRTATPAQIKQDLIDSEFEAFYGFGPKVDFTRWEFTNNLQDLSCNFDGTVYAF